MARPQTESGFVQIAHDLFAALMSADLPNREMIVLAEVLLHCYGRPKSPSVHLDPAAIEHYTGLHRNNVRKAIGDLVAAGILAREPDGSHRFVKDWESWRPKGGPLSARLGGGIDRFARSAKSRFDKPGKGSTSTAIQRDCDACDESTSATIQPDPHDNCLVNPTGLPLQLSGQSNGIDPHIEEPARNGELENERIENHREYVRAADTHAPGGDDPVISQPGRTPEDAAAVHAAARSLAGDLRTAHLGQRLLSEHNTPGLIGLEGWRWVLAANVQLGPKLTHSQRSSWPYLVAIARNLTDQDRDAPAGGGATEPAESKASARARLVKESLLRARVPMPKGIEE